MTNSAPHGEEMDGFVKVIRRTSAHEQFDNSLQNQPERDGGNIID